MEHSPRTAEIRYSDWSLEGAGLPDTVGTEFRAPATDRTLSGVWKNPSEIALLASNKIKGF